MRRGPGRPRVPDEGSGAPMHEEELPSDAVLLQGLIDELRETKARDLAAKRAGRTDERPGLGRAIYDLMRAIQAARGGDLG